MQYGDEIDARGRAREVSSLAGGGGPPGGLPHPKMENVEWRDVCFSAEIDRSHSPDTYYGGLATSFAR